MAAADLDPAARLCVCETRGCKHETAHRAAFVVPEPRWRAVRKAARKHRRRT